MKRKIIMYKLEPFIFIAIFSLAFWYLGSVMGVANFLNTAFNTAFKLLTETVWYLMAITVLAGAFGAMMSEFGVVRILETILAPLIRPLFNLPGVAALGGFITFFSDNPAIITLTKEKKFAAYFKKYQFLSLTNFGTAFGMGMIVLTFMFSNGYFISTIIGLFAAMIGGVISVRLFQKFIRKKLIEEGDDEKSENEKNNLDTNSETTINKMMNELQHNGTIIERILNSILNGGKQGVEIGLAIIPGVLIISTIVFMFSKGAGPDGYSGAAFEGVPLITKIGDFFSWFFKYAFGFNDGQFIAFPITALGSVGAALALLKNFINDSATIITGNEIAVFTAIGLCWSGYISTHTAMMDALGYRKFTSYALISHTIGGIVAGIIAHWLFVLIDIFYSGIK